MNCFTGGKAFKQMWPGKQLLVKVSVETSTYLYFCYIFPTSRRDDGQLNPNRGRGVVKKCLHRQTLVAAVLLEIAFRWRLVLILWALLHSSSMFNRLT